MSDKHAYLIIAHNKFEQLQFLLSLLDHPRNDIFLMLDKRFELSDDKIASLKRTLNKSSLYFVPRLSIYWGGGGAGSSRDDIIL